MKARNASSFISGRTPEMWSGPLNQIVGMLSKATGLSLTIYCFKWLLSKSGGGADGKRVAGPGLDLEV